MNSEPHNIEWSDEQLDTALMAHLDTVRHALLLTRRENPPEAPTEETLARYLDNSLSETERDELEAQLTDSPKDLSRLIALHRETKRIMNPELQIATVEKHFAASQVDYEVGKAAHLKATQELTPLASEVESEHISRPQAASENG